MTSHATRPDAASPPARRGLTALADLSRRAFTLDARSLAVYRIGLGLLLVADSITRFPDVAILLGPDGVFPLEALTRYHGTITLWSLSYLHDSVAWSVALLVLEGLAGVALTLGWQTRLATVLGWMALVSVIRRSSPAANAGDVWLACQLFWSMFLPLGARWSIDARRRESAGAMHAPPITAACSSATVALVLQIASIYVSAGLAKCNADWLTGDALVHALSVHDHGTPLGMTLARSPGLTRVLQWLVIACEILLPIAALVRPTPRVRVAAVAMFAAFHAAIGMGMTVGLFPMIGIVAWIPLLPAPVWSRPQAWSTSSETGEPNIAMLGTLATIVCGVAGALSAAAILLQLPPWRHRLPIPLTMATNLLALHQEWQMFGNVPSREQWVYSRAILADGSEVDILRGGKPVERDHPSGGFTSLPNHRWHTFFWHLVKPEARVFAEPAAKAIADHWNARHAPDRQVVSVEIRYGFQPDGEDEAIRDVLFASWPPRSNLGAGNLDRFLQSVGDQSPAP